MKRSRKKGFTLVELVVVVVILGILAAIAVPRVFDTISDANDKARLSTASAIRTAIMMEVSNNDGEISGISLDKIKASSGVQDLEALATSGDEPSDGKYGYFFGKKGGNGADKDDIVFVIKYKEGTSVTELIKK